LIEILRMIRRKGAFQSMNNQIQHFMAGQMRCDIYHTLHYA
jgi:hypothetical protein